MKIQAGLGRGLLGGSLLAFLCLQVPVARAQSYNTSLGTHALVNNTPGSYDTAVGWGALRYNTSGDFNTALGKSALYYNEGGNECTAIGHNALYQNHGSFNTAVGASAAPTK